jgi:hypothetical protein
MEDYQPWQYWKTQEGYPLDRRLGQTVRVWETDIGIADLLSAAAAQTGVRLSALEPELCNQEVTTFVSDLPLNALMVQLADLLGLYWYERQTEGGAEYVLTYGSSPPGQRAQEDLDKRQPYFSQVRASRIADYVRALSLSDDELRELGKNDPTLADTMLRSKDARLVVDTLSELPRAILRRLIETGDALVEGNQLPGSYKDALHRAYANPANAASFARIGITSEDALLQQYRLHLVAPAKVFEPSDQMIYDLYGPMWPGIQALEKLALRTNSGAGDRNSGEPISFILGQAGACVLPGKLDGKDRAKTLYPKLTGGDVAQSRTDALNKLIADTTRARQGSESSSPFKDDRRLSQPAQFAITANMRTSDLLRAIADQTKCSVFATYYEQHNHFVGAPTSEREPLYVLLNHVAQRQGCSWLLQGDVVRWQHNEWFLFEKEPESPDRRSQR